jgi:haloalkane dehalogenase
MQRSETSAPPAASRAIPNPAPVPDAVVPTRAEVVAALARGPHAWLDVGHSRLAYWRFGHGPDLVFMHGWPLHSATFRDLVPLLAGDFTCHLVDLPGAGLTEYGAEAPIDLAGHVATLRSAIDALGLTRYAILAHDSGGYFARVIAATDRRVVAISTGNTEIPGHFPWLVALLATVVKLPGGAALFRLMLASRSLRRSFLGFGGAFADRDRLDGEFHDYFVAPLLAEASSRGQLRLLESVDADSLAGLRTVHSQIRVPVQLIWGEDDGFFPLAKVRPMIAEFPHGAELVTIARAKVFVHEEHPHPFAEHARRFLREAFAR